MTGWVLDWVYVGSIVVYLTVMIRWGNGPPGLLIGAVFFTWQTAYFLLATVMQLPVHSVVGGVWAGMDAMWSAVSFWVAQRCWDDWRRRRKRRGRVRGRTAVRLGRLVIVPGS